MKPSYCNTLLMTLCVATGLSVAAETVKNPQLYPTPLDALLPSWKNANGGVAFAQGSYLEGTSNYKLKGNGNGIYWCWDRAAAAIFNDANYETQLRGDFTFTAKLKSIDQISGNGSAGIFIKEKSSAYNSPVISLRWDNHHKNFTWFNRQVSSNHIAPLENVKEADKGTMHGNWPGVIPGSGWDSICLGDGYWDKLDGYTTSNDVWLRISRKGTEYNLFSKKDGESNWTQIEKKRYQ